MKTSGFHQRVSRTAISAAMPRVIQRSCWEMPRISPKSAASKSRVKVRARLITAMPIAKAAVVTMPIAASPPIWGRREAMLIISTEIAPQTLAPIKKLMPLTKEITAPPKMLCASPCPM